jgi:hypothetical protein
MSEPGNQRFDVRSATEYARTSYIFAHRIACALVVLCAFSLLPACGSGGSGDSGSGGGSNAPTITGLNPSSTKAGESAFTLTVNGTNFTATGTTAKWNGTALATTYVGASKVTVPVTAAMIAAAGSAAVTVTTASGTSAGVTFTIDPQGPTVTAAHAPLRTKYLRNNSFYDPNALQYAPPHFAVYDSAHQQFFVSNPYMNEIDVFSSTSETQTATISVPMAWGIDISPVDGSLWAGTLLGDVYNISTLTLGVIQRYPASTIGPSGFEATTALVLADGRLALQGAAGGFLGIDGFASPIVWNPETNAVDTGPSIYGSICPYSNGAFALDGSRMLVLSTTVDEDGAGAPLCSYDTVTRVETDVTIPQAEVTYVRQIVPSPDGKKFFLTTNLDGVEVFDPKTLQQIGQIPPPSSLQGFFWLPDAANGAVMSLDGKTLYLRDEVSGKIWGYDTTTYQHVSTVANIEISDLQSQIIPMAIDSSGLMIGPIGHGVGFADAGAPETLSAADPVQLVNVAPDTGALSDSTPITGTIWDLGLSDAGTSSALSEFYVGNSLISGAEVDSNGSMSATTPAASSGMAVDLTALFADGTIGLAPEAFSYGPTILEVVPNAATADGGQQGAVVGYGFGSSASAVSITVGGQSAPVQELYNYQPYGPYPFPVETLTFTIPPGAAGPSTISITSSSGTTTGAFTYTPSSASYPVAAALQQGVYDARRNLYFFSDTAKIQVFSPASKTWQPPITLPGTTSTSQLIGIAESPDGSMLAVADNGGQAIYVLDPDNPGSAVRYPVPSPANGSYPSPPFSLAVLDNKSIYYVAVDVLNQVAGSASFHELDPTTGRFIDFQIGDVGTPELNGGRVLLSPDQSTVYLNIAGIVYWIDTATDTVNLDSETGRGFQTADGAISSDGSTISIDGYLTDSSLNVETLPAYIDWETWLPTATYGQKLSADGSILYQPLANGVDLIERNTGHLLYRVQVPGAVASVYDSMFLGQGGTLGFITSSGITLVDLSSLSIPASASTPFPAASPTEGLSGGMSERNALKALSRAETHRPALKHTGISAKSHGASSINP